jgi:hypothetical protein
MAAQKPVVAVFAENESFIDREFFSSIGAQIVYFFGNAELARYLKTSRPHALCIAASPQTYFSRPQWLKDIERRGTFEGLRVLAFVIVPRGAHSDLVKMLEDSRDELLRVRFTATLAMRDVLVAEQPPFSLGARKQLLSRVLLALGSVSSFSGEDGLSALVRDLRTIRLGFAGRISWLGVDGLVSLECGVRVAPGTVCRVRLANFSGNSLVIDATAISSTSNNLRFNFGSEVTLRLDAAQLRSLENLFALEDKKALDDGRPVMRGLIVLRNADVRERIVELLRSRRCEVRVPLVSKTVKNDVARMNPQMVILEDAVILAQPNAKDYLKELRGTLAPEAYISVIGPNAASLVGNLPNVYGFGLPEVELSLRSVLSKLEERRDGSDKNRQWFSAESDFATCVVEVEDKAIFIGNTGIVVEGPHIYRSLSNAYLTFGKTPAQILVKSTGSYVVSDSWKLSGHQTAHSRYYFSTLMDTKSYRDDYRLLIDRVSQLRVPQSSPALSLKSSPLNDVTPKPREDELPLDSSASAKGRDALSPTLQKLRDVKESAERDVDLSEEREAFSFSRDYVRSVPKKRVAKKSASSPKDWMMVALLFVVIGIIVSLVFMYGNQNDSYLTGSFEKLYQFYGK